MLATVSVPVCVRGTGHQATTKIFMLYRGVGVGVRECVCVGEWDVEQRESRAGGWSMGRERDREWRMGESARARA